MSGQRPAAAPLATLPTRHSGAYVDALEPRRLFAATLEVTRTLVINATDADDIVFIDLDIGPQQERILRVTENSVVTGRFAQVEVNDLLIHLGDGNDYLRVGSGGFVGSVATPTRIEGGEGNDEINGGSGVDNIFGGGGDDFITGYAGNDFIDGGEGNDVVVVQIGNDTVLGGPGDDQLNGQEKGKGSTFDGGDGNDQITGTSRKDTIRGGAGNDLIDGGRGADKVFGGDGDDQITVNLNSAKLRGEAGADVFLITGNRGRGSIKDFTEGEDSIQPAPPAGTFGATSLTAADLHKEAASLLG